MGEISNDQPFVISETEWIAVKTLLDKRYVEISNLLRYNKTREDSIQRLSQELQKYREGFAFIALKPFIIALISLREDCRKSMRDAEQFVVDEEKAKKFINYLTSDLSEMLLNVGLERVEKAIFYNGKPLISQAISLESQTSESIGEIQKEDSNQIIGLTGSINNISELIEFLNKSETAIRLMLQDRAAIDKALDKYIALASRTDAEHLIALVAPVAKQLFSLYDDSSIEAEVILKCSGDEIIQRYYLLLEKLINEMAEILVAMGTSIEVLDNGVFDSQKHRLLKTTPTDDENLDRHIACAYSDCYIYDGKIIYQAKVDVYKFQKSN